MYASSLNSFMDGSSFLNSATQGIDFMKDEENDDMHSIVNRRRRAHRHLRKPDTDAIHQVTTLSQALQSNPFLLNEGMFHDIVPDPSLFLADQNPAHFLLSRHFRRLRGNKGCECEII